MSTNFPTSLDSFTNPGPTDAMNASPALNHDVQHDNENDAITALEVKIGIDGSAATGSLDYKSKKGSFIRTTSAQASSSLAAGATDSSHTLTIGKGCLLIKLATDYPAWVRIYASAADQSADASRAITTDPTAGTGVLLEVVTTAGALSVDLSPAVIASSLESSPGTTLHFTITNKDSVTRTIATTVTLIPVEG
jgi:hypothetical protein